MIADMTVSGAGKEVIHDYVVGALKRTALEKYKGPQGVETWVIDTPDGLDRGLCGKHLDGRRGHYDVGELAQDIGYLGRGWRATHSNEEALIRWTNNEIGPNAVRLDPVTFDIADHNADDREDHGDFDGHGQNTDGGSQRPV